MNRILVDEGLDEIVTKNQDTIILDIKENINLLINDSKYKYIFNVYSADLNILSILENKGNIDIEFNIEKGNVIFNSLNYNGENEKINVFLNKEDSTINIYNSLISKKSQNVNVCIYHKSSKTYSNIYNFGVTSNDGSILFDIISKVDKGFKKCILNQDSKIISLNNENNNKINPILLIDEYDTEAKHSAFIGKFSDNELFYLQSRGIKKSDAYKLLLEGFLVGIMKISAEEKKLLKDKMNNDWR